MLFLVVVPTTLQLWWLGSATDRQALEIARLRAALASHQHGPAERAGHSLPVPGPDVHCSPRTWCEGPNDYVTIEPGQRWTTEAFSEVYCWADRPTTIRWTCVTGPESFTQGASGGQGEILRDDSKPCTYLSVQNGI